MEPEIQSTNKKPTLKKKGRKRKMGELPCGNEQH
jgi:hypothetical protein